MYIIGTAGHVDHGKTMLIRALTGIDTDRLPEEKKRGMTIDLGFAHFPGAGTEIGVVDVPGHEKFIRNMVAGAWGIDLALLVIAADDGWMFQTENHLRVLTAMGISKIIAVITKSDITGPETAAAAEEDARLRLLENTGTEYPSIAVSAETGYNIEALKELIISEISRQPAEGQAEKTGPGEPLMFIDRAFSIQGAGLVVTGSLREGSVRKNDMLKIYPAGTDVRIRDIQTYDSRTETAIPACRAAFNLSGASLSGVKRGCCLTTERSGISAETEFVLELAGKPENIRNHSEVEFAAGTAHSTGSIHFIHTGEDRGPRLRARAVLSEALPLRTGQPVVIIRKGGSMITGSGMVIWKGPTTKSERRSIAAAEDSAPQALNLFVKGWVRNTEGWEFTPDRKKQVADDILKLASEARGAGLDELPGKLNIAEGAVKQIIEELVKSDKISEKHGIFFKKGKTALNLPDKARRILSEMDKAGEKGMDLTVSRIPGARAEIRTLVRAGLAVPLSENLFLTEENFSMLCNRILEGLGSGDSFPISHAKERTGLSRKYIIPLLNRMEERGIVVREENLRRIL